MFQIAVLLSGSGSNLQAIIDRIEDRSLNCCISHVISDREGTVGIERAKKHRLPTRVLSRTLYGAALSDKILETIEGQADLIVLAGYLSVLTGQILDQFKYRIINVHPSLLPSFGGKGMYGLKVHEAALDYGVKITGCSVHFVDEGTDTGKIILQQAVRVDEGDTAQTLQKKVLVQEHLVLPEAIRLLSQNQILIEDGRVRRRR